MACRNSGFSEGSVVGVVTELQDILKQRLREGQTVNIRSHITRIVCGFLPAGRRIQGRHILYDLCNGVKAVWQKDSKR